MFRFGSGFAYASWLGLWSTHLDKKRESFEWCLYSTFVGIGTAVSAAVGGILAEYIGFRLTFAVVGAIAYRQIQLWVGGIIAKFKAMTQYATPFCHLPPPGRLGNHPLLACKYDTILMVNVLSPFILN